MIQTNTQETAKSLGNILVVDDDPGVVESHCYILREWGYSPIAQTDPREVLADLESHPEIDLVLLDIRMPHVDGMDLLRQIKQRHPVVGVILVTVIDEPSCVVAAIRQGAFGYIEKAAPLEELRAEIALYFSRNPRCPAPDRDFAAFVTQCPALIDDLFPRIRSLAIADVPIMVEGETGTGKDLTARLIHDLSARRCEPFVPVPVAALNVSLFDAELFGHRRGAFSGADDERIGYLEHAGSGTIFLDEIGDLGHDQQIKLLRVLEDGRFCRLGENHPRPLRARVVMATNRDLLQSVREHRFREDLFHRLSSHRIVLPPLRERTGDIAYLTSFFLRKYCAKFDITPVKTCAPETILALNRCPFPGNVRQLEGMIRHAVLMEKGPIIGPALLPSDFINTRKGGGELEQQVRSAQYQAIMNALAACNDNHTAAAKRLGISRTTFYRLLAHSNDQHAS